MTILLSLKQPFGQMAMTIEQMENYDFVLKGAKKTKKITEKVVKSNKCNQCDYTSSCAGNLRQHLKIQSEEKSNKCNQSDYKSSRAGNLRQHEKYTVKKSHTNATSVITNLLGQAI